MRVIAGIAKGHRLVAPEGRAVRPTSDRAKEALFSVLMPRLRGAAVVDLFAGSGALGIEALSRGAARVTFVEDAPAALAAMEDNLDHTGLRDGVSVVRWDVLTAVEAGLPGAPFDIAVLDPPYDFPRDELAAVLTALVPHLAAGAVVSVESGRHAGVPPWPPGVLAGRTRRYGDTVLYAGHVPEETPV